MKTRKVYCIQIQVAIILFMYDGYGNTNIIIKQCEAFLSIIYYIYIHTHAHYKQNIHLVPFISWELHSPVRDSTSPELITVFIRAGISRDYPVRLWKRSFRVGFFSISFFFFYKFFTCLAGFFRSWSDSIEFICYTSTANRTTLIYRNTII